MLLNVNSESNVPVVAYFEKIDAILAKPARKGYYFEELRTAAFAEIIRLAEVASEFIYQQTVAETNQYKAWYNQANEYRYR